MPCWRSYIYRVINRCHKCHSVTAISKTIHYRVGLPKAATSVERFQTQKWDFLNNYNGRNGKLIGFELRAPPQVQIRWVFRSSHSARPIFTAMSLPWILKYAAAFGSPTLSLFLEDFPKSPWHRDTCDTPLAPYTLIDFSSFLWHRKRRNKSY